MRTFIPEQALVPAVMWTRVSKKGEAAAHFALFGLCLYYVFDWWCDDKVVTHLHLLRAIPFLYSHGTGTFCWQETFQSCINIHIHSHMCTCHTSFARCSIYPSLTLRRGCRELLKAVLVLLKFFFSHFPHFLTDGHLWKDWWQQRFLLLVFWSSACPFKEIYLLTQQHSKEVQPAVLNLTVL